MKRLFIAIMALCALTFTGASAYADEDSQPRHRTVGVGLDVGVPDGVAVGVVVRPVVNWLRLEAAGTYNLMAPGIRGGLTLDPVNFGVAPTFTFEGGHAFEGNVPHIDKQIGVQYNYANLHLGLEFGRRDYWRIFLRGGVSYLDLQTSGFQNATKVGGFNLDNPSFDGWLPSAKLGFALYF